MIRNVSVTPSLISCVLLLSGCGGGGGGSAEDPPDLAGVIDIESQTRVDSDTADDLRLDQFASNDSDGEAQPLPVTGIAGGYLSPDSGTYPVREGESFQFDFESDPQDYYTADLSPGDRVSLQVFDDSRMDEPQPRLQVFDGDDRTVFDSNDANGSLPFVHVIDSASGNHVIRISTESGGPFRYVLIAADSGASSVMNTAYSEPDFMPGEVVVTASAGHPSEVSANSMASALSAEFARELRPGVGSRISPPLLPITSIMPRPFLLIATRCMTASGITN
ncbi:MAG: hypothetical protein LC687_06805 [Actinobacteria bacterium]|nr:hypothetical protein [Actinomycetota bacterium]